MRVQYSERLMRYSLLYLLIILSLPLCGQRFRATLAGGLNLSQIDGDGLGGFHQIGGTAGLRVTAVLSDRWQFGPELLFSQEGSRKSNREGSQFGFDRIRLNLVQVPLMVYFSDWKVQAGAGISYGRLIDFRVEDISGADLTSESNFAEDIVAIQLGATLYFQPRLGLNVRWSKYLNDLEQEAGRNSLRGRTLSVRLLYVLGDSAWVADDL